MIETKFFERIDRFSAWNLWRITPDGRVYRYSHGRQWWNSVEDPCIVADLSRPEVFRPISKERLLFLQKVGI
jgi:hypothetical protein